MTPLSLRLATALVRAWTSAYTWWLESSARDARRAEIESDLWEQIQATDIPPSALNIIGRLVRGMPDDLGWTMEQRTSTSVFARRAMFVAAGSAVLMSVWWVGTISRTVSTPPPPPAPSVQWLSKGPLPAPPPPPPPLCNPPGLPSFSPCTKWP